MERAPFKSGWDSLSLCIFFLLSLSRYYFIIRPQIASAHVRIQLIHCVPHWKWRSRSAGNEMERAREKTIVLLK